MSLTSEQIEKLGEIIERAFKPFFEFAKEVQKTTDVDQLWTSLESATPEDFESNPEILIDGDGCAIKPIKEIHKPQAKRAFRGIRFAFPRSRYTVFGQRLLQLLHALRHLQVSPEA